MFYLKPEHPGFCPRPPWDTAARRRRRFAAAVCLNTHVGPDGAQGNKEWGWKIGRIKLT